MLKCIQNDWEEMAQPLTHGAERLVMYLHDCDERGTSERITNISFSIRIRKTMHM
jgi:hypothetical protein